MPALVTTKITVTPADRDWLRFVAEVLSGKHDASEHERKAGAQALYRLAYRADRADSTPPTKETR
jgi:hypothetical protein